MTLISSVLDGVGITAGVATELDGTLDGDAIYALISSYVLEWRAGHDIPIPSELAAQA